MEDKEDEIDLIALDSFCQLVLEENIDEIEVLLTSSPELANAMDKWNWTPLHYAAMRGKKSIVDLLLQNGGNPNLEDKFGDTPLTISERWGQEQVFSVLSNQLTVSCSNSESGCDFEGKASELEEHLATCEFREVPCSLGCGFSLPFIEWEKDGKRDMHENEECLCRRMECPRGCGMINLHASDISEHLERDCIKNLEKPVNQWGTDEISIWLKQVVRLPQYTSLFKEKNVRGPQLIVIQKPHCRDLGVQVRLHIQRITSAISLLRERSSFASSMSMMSSSNSKDEEVGGSGGEGGDQEWICDDEKFEGSQKSLKEWITEVDPACDPAIIQGFLDVVIDYEMLPYVQDLDLERDVGVKGKLSRDVFLQSIPRNIISSSNNQSNVSMSPSTDTMNSNTPFPSMELPPSSLSPPSSSSPPNSSSSMGLLATTTMESKTLDNEEITPNIINGNPPSSPMASRPTTVQEANKILTNDPVMTDILIGPEDLSPSDWQSQSHKLGEGGFGAVYKANYGDSHQVAVKIFKGSEAGVRAELFNEAKSALRVCHHPNIIKIWGIMLMPLAIVLEFMENGSAWDLMKKGNDLRDVVIQQEGLLCRMVLDSARGVDFLHKQSPAIIHRDLAARNLLVDATFRVKVSDFGLSRSKHYFESRGFTQTNWGPIKYSGPEVLNSKMHEYSTMSDVYSFGVAVYEMATGRPPWENLDPLAAAQRVQRGLTLEFLDEDGVSRELQTLMTRCWATDPHERPVMDEIVELMAEYDDSPIYDTLDD